MSSMHVESPHSGSPCLGGHLHLSGQGGQRHMLEARGRDFLRENGSYEVRAQSKEREGKERKVDKRLSFEVKKEGVILEPDGYKKGKSSKSHSEKKGGI